MGSTTRDIFGDATGAAPATAGTYGEPPRGYRLPESTRLGAVKLQVADVARSTTYYESTLGLRVVRRERAQVVLATNEDDAPLVVLEEFAGARPAPRRGRLGLYHFAILLPDRPSLGRFMRHLGEIGARAGAADHLVSEAFYLQDPDNLGIEVYADRPRDTWRRVGRELMMATDPIDAAGLTQAAGDEPWRGMPAGATIGHVHLHIGDIDAGSAFFSNALGFDRMVWHYPGALFLGAGGYHHHLGTNTWAGAGATAAAADEARLLEWTIQLPNAASVAGAAESIERAGYPVEREGNESATEIVTRDPWGTPIRLITTEAAASRP